MGRTGKQLEQFFPVVTHEKPSPNDIELDQTLFKFMSKHVPVEITSELQRRERVLASLKTIFAGWVKKVCLTKGLPDELAAEAGGQIYTSGSYRLGVHEPGADIDTICVAPQHCTREDFFTSLREELAIHPQVTNLTAIDSAAVPIMSFDFDTVNIDLLFASLPLNAIPATLDIDDDLVLQGVDTATEKSLNGPRVTNLIVKLIPNFDNFLPVLRCIRSWAKRRGLYSNKLGYLGGVNWCILVALVCQLYPNGTPSYILLKFFKVLAQWIWPNPIHLCNPVNNPNLGYEVWDPRLHHNRFHMMPIITPAYPGMNSSVSVSAPTLEVMKEEFIRGFNLMQKVTQEGGSMESWEELFAPSDFFARYSHYLALNIVAYDEDSFRAWSGFVESRIRKLLDHMGRLPVSRLHLSPQKFKNCTVPLSISVPHSMNQGEDGDGASQEMEVIERKGVCYFLAFEVDPKKLEGSTLSIDGPVQTFKNYELGRFNQLSEGMDLLVSHHSWKQLPDFVFEGVGGKAKAREIHKKYIRKKKEKDKASQGEATHDSAPTAETVSQQSMASKGEKDPSGPDTVPLESEGMNSNSVETALAEQGTDELEDPKPSKDKRPDQPWWNEDLSAIRKAYTAASRHHDKTGSPSSLSELRRHRTAYRKACKAARDKWSSGENVVEQSDLADQSRDAVGDSDPTDNDRKAGDKRAAKDTTEPQSPPKKTKVDEETRLSDDEVKSESGNQGASHSATADEVIDSGHVAEQDQQNCSESDSSSLRMAQDVAVERKNEFDETNLIQLKSVRHAWQKSCGTNTAQPTGLVFKMLPR